jgi:hypothetical protein
MHPGKIFHFAQLITQQRFSFSLYQVWFLEEFLMALSFLMIFFVIFMRNKGLFCGWIGK